MGLSFAIIGCGKVGGMLGRQLARAGYRPAGFYSRRPESALHAARMTVNDAGAATGMVHEKPWNAARQADVVFITTPDQAIETVCGEVADKGGFRKGAVVLHCSGALPSTVLTAACSCGAHVASMHPLQSFAGESAGNPFHSIMMAVEGEGPALEIAKAIAVDLSARPFVLPTEGKTFYHASAVVASNYLVTVMDLAFQLMAAAGVPESSAFGVLAPLIRGTLANLETIGIPNALTGPIARGDIDIVEKHLGAIRGLSSELAARYARLGSDTISLALAKGTLSEEAARRLRDLFGGESF